MLVGHSLSLAARRGGLSLIQQAIGILRKYGADAHVYLPGVGTVNGITAGNYLDSAGTTAASVDNPVGLSLDALQAMTLGPELVTNGDFASGTTGFASAGVAASTMSVVAGEAQLIPTVGYGRQIQAIACVSGGTYRLTGKARVISGGSRAFIGITTSSVGASATTIGNTLSSTQVPLSGQFVASATTMYLVFGDDLNAAGGTLGFDDISIKQIPGVHATQATTANKPILRRGLLNQLLWSQDISNAIWSKSKVGFTTGQIGPDGATANAILVYPNLTGISPGVFQAITRSLGIDSTTFRVKAAGFSWVAIVGTNGSGSQVAWFNLTTGVKGSVTGGIASSIVPVGNGFYDCTITSPASSNPYAQLAIVDGDGSTNGTANGTNGVIVSIAGLFQGTYTAQQILDAGGIPLTTSAAASSATGKYWWQFDGSNDHLTTTFSAGTLGANSDVFMVVRRDTAGSTVLAYSADNNNKYIGSCATSGTSATSVGAGTPTHYVNGVVLSAQTEVAMSAALPAGSTCIVEVQGANLSTWVNFNVGYYAASAAFAFNGQIYDCIICPAMTANERTTIRKYLAQKNGITLA